MEVGNVCHHCGHSIHLDGPKLFVPKHCGNCVSCLRTEIGMRLDCELTRKPHSDGDPYSFPMPKMPSH